MTLGEFPAGESRNYLRKVIIRMKWDDESHPSVEVPIGDFFGMGHAQTKNFNSLPLSMDPENGQGSIVFLPRLFLKVRKLKYTVSIKIHSYCTFILIMSYIINYPKIIFNFMLPGEEKIHAGE